MKVTIKTGRGKNETFEIRDLEDIEIEKDFIFIHEAGLGKKGAYKSAEAIYFRNEIVSITISDV